MLKRELRHTHPGEGWALWAGRGGQGSQGGGWQLWAGMGRKGPGWPPGPRCAQGAPRARHPLDGHESPQLLLCAEPMREDPELGARAPARVESGTRVPAGRAVTRGQRRSGTWDRVTWALPARANAPPGKRAGGASSRGWGYAAEEELPQGRGAGGCVCGRWTEMKGALSQAGQGSPWKGPVGAGQRREEDVGSRRGAMVWGHLEPEAAVGRDKFQAVPVGGGGLAGP